MVRDGETVVRGSTSLVQQLECCSNDFPMKKSAQKRSIGKAGASAPLRVSAHPVPVVTSAPMAIGGRLRHARLVKGLLIKQLAERVGVSISLISKYENDKLLPPLTVLHSLVTELETNIGALFVPNWTGLDYVARAGGRTAAGRARKADADPAILDLAADRPAGR